ncbi:phage tail tube protein [Lutibacter holmesii]|uniref:Phage tail tube protein n=1 Tax=Lutibacter holmesii TaxID=1137985 RepID=A0ABW3WLP3_9FLAO
MAFQDGSLMRLSVDGENIFHETKVSISGDTDFNDVATKDTDGTVSTPGQKSWSLSVEGVMSNDDPGTKHDVASIVGLWNTQALVEIMVTDAVTGHIEYSGSAYIQNWSKDAENDESVTFSYSLKGTGSLTVGAVA